MIHYRVQLFPLLLFYIFLICVILELLHCFSQIYPPRPPLPPPTDPPPNPRKLPPLNGDDPVVAACPDETIPVTTVSPSDNPEVISVSVSEVMPVSTGVKVIFPFCSTRTVVCPLEV